MSILDATAKVSKPVPSHDWAHDVLRSQRHPLDAIFAPRSVAVIGATERQGSIGRAVLWSLVSSPFGGTVYPVSDKRASGWASRHINGSRISLSSWTWLWS